jgi:O-antigen/teichoic acid export membrane protein
VKIDRSALFSLLCYALAIALASGSNFLTAPLLLALVGPAGFAHWALVEPLVLALIPIAGFGINYGLMQAVAQRADAPQRVIGGLLPFHLAASLLVALIAGGIALASWAPTVALLCAAIVLVEGVIALFITYWRTIDRPGFFALVEGGRAALVVLLLAAAWVAAPAFISTVPAYMAVRAGVGAAAILLAVAVIRPIGRGTSQDAMAAVRFGFPIVCASVLVSLTTTIDRYAVAHFATLAAISGYVAQVKLVQILGSALAPFFTWFAPVAIRRLPEGEAAHGFFSGSVYAFQAVNACATLGMWFLAPMLWRPLFGALPFDASLFAVLLIGQMIFALGNPVSVGTLRPGKTWQALRATIVTLAVMAAGCLVLGGLYGPIGVAWGRAIGFGAYTLVLGAGTVRDLGIGFPWARMAVFSIPVVAIIISTTGQLAAMSLWVALPAITIGCLLVLGIALLLRPRSKVAS